MRILQNIRNLLLLGLLPFLAVSCMKWDYGSEEEFQSPANGLFILCEGNFQYGNAELSFYNPATNTVSNDVFYRANGMKLGDVGMSMNIFDGKGWIVVNNSHVVFAIDLTTFKEVGRIENLTSPRFIHFVSEEKAYVSQLWDNRIYIVNPKTYEVKGYIPVPGMAMESGSTEQMVQVGKYVYCSCWSYQNKILKIDSDTDEVVSQLTVGAQPFSLVVDCEGMLWTMTDGGYEGSPFLHEAPALYRIDPDSFSVVKRFEFNLGNTVKSLLINHDGTTLWWINEGVWRMPIDALKLPELPIIESIDTKYFCLTLSPEDEDIYVADAIDYQQSGMIYRYNSGGDLIDKFYVGVTPSYFCWKK